MQVKIAQLVNQLLKYLTYILAVQSIFTLPGVQLSKDPGYRSSAFNHASSGKSRRQSMLL